ncbi:MAG: S1C family serine protease [Fimbriimonadaceae bacterium]
MKTTSVVAVAVAAFVGAFGAREAARWLDHRPQAAHLAVPRELTAQNVDYQPVTGGPADFRAAAKKVLPSVVSIDKYERVDHFFSEDSSIEETASGSGVIISRDGIIVTNNHVVENATEVRVRLPDRRSFTATVVGTDRVSDLAVLKVNADNLTPVEMGDSDKLEVGQWVLAVGNPLGYDGTLSAGVVSNKSRSLGTQESVLVNAIQTDAPINPGNSGGALTDADGRLVGINSAISSNTGTNIGIGFAIPVNRVKRVAREIIETGHARNPYMGLVLSPRFDGFLSTADGRQQLADRLNVKQVPSDGVLIPEAGRIEPVAPGSPAAKAGLRSLDVILEVDGKPISDHLDYFSALDGKRPGDKVQMKIWSRGTTKTVTVTLTEEPIDS